MKYRRKPEIIEAIQLRRDTWDEVCELISSAAKYPFHPQIGEEPYGFYINRKGETTIHSHDSHGREHERIAMMVPTSKGLLEIRDGDYAVKESNNEIKNMFFGELTADYEPEEVV